MNGQAACPYFSIVIPTYQRRDLVCDCIGSLAKLDYAGPVELVIVVDGSTDGTVEALAALDPPFPMQVFVQPNRGLAHARNAGAAAAHGDVLLFIDDDMVCRPDIVTQHARTYGQGADAVIGNIPVDDSSPPGFLTQGVAAFELGRAEAMPGGRVLSPFEVYGGQISVRRAVFEELGGFDGAFTEDGKYGKEDADLAAKLLAAHDVRHNPEAVSHQRFVVGPRDYLKRGFELGRADVRFARRHLRFSQELFERNNASRPRVRFLLRPLASIPLLPRIAVEVTALLAAGLLSTPLRNSSLFAKFFHAVRNLAYWSGVRAGGGVPREQQAMVLCYHAIADHGFDPIIGRFSIPQPRFEAHLESLRRRKFCFVSAHDILRCHRDGVPLPKRAILLTFDDCYVDLLDVAREMLAPRGIPALAFAVTAMASHTNEWDQKIGVCRLELLDWHGLRQLREHGVEIGSHSRTHRAMPELADDDLAVEAAGAADDIEAQGLPRPAFFAYPYGERDLRCEEAVAVAGYAAAFGLNGKRVSPADSRFDLSRVELLSDDGPWRFWLKTTSPRLAQLIEWRMHARRLKARLLELFRRSSPPS